METGLGELGPGFGQPLLGLWKSKGFLYKTLNSLQQCGGLASGSSGPACGSSCQAEAGFGSSATWASSAASSSPACGLERLWQPWQLGGAEQGGGSRACLGQPGSSCQAEGGFGSSCHVG